MGEIHPRIENRDDGVGGALGDAPSIADIGVCIDEAHHRTGRRISDRVALTSITKPPLIGERWISGDNLVRLADPVRLGCGDTWLARQSRCGCKYVRGWGKLNDTDVQLWDSTPERPAGRRRESVLRSCGNPWAELNDHLPRNVRGQHPGQSRARGLPVRLRRTSPCDPRVAYL
jgi:hypothetical protein